MKRKHATPNSKITRIQNLMQAGHFDEAERLLRTLCARSGADSQTWFLLGYLQGKRGDAASAESCFRKALARKPKFIQAQFNLGIALRDQGRLDEARIELVDVVTTQPDHAEAHNALGCILLRLARQDDAEHCFRNALASNPMLLEALNNLGGILLSLQQWLEAATLSRRALSIAPGNTLAALNLGRALVGMDQLEEALPFCRQAVAGNPKNPMVHTVMGGLLRKLGRIEEAKKSFQTVLEIAPNHGEARHTLAILDGGSSQSVAPVEYVTELFDGYADSFDAHLVEKLQYNVPELLEKAIREALGQRSNLDVLDLGCGTGLCGLLIKPMSRSLAGVDLSPKMVAKARERAVYDELEVGELIGSLSRRARELDLVLAADVFVYIGDLSHVFDAVAKALRANGLFAFSVETATEGEGDMYTLRCTGRYAHAHNYVTALTNRFGFKLVFQERIDVRLGIPGAIYLLQCRS